MGGAVSLLIAWLSFRLLGNDVNLLSIKSRHFFRLLLYLPYFIKEIVKANVDVAERVLRPDLPISPMIVRFRFPLKTPVPQVTMANSITLTPGTLTVEIDKEGVFYIHCLAEDHAEGLLEGDLRRHVLWIYEEKESD